MSTYQIDTSDGHTYEVTTEEGPGKLESFGRAAVNNLPLGGQLGALGTAASTPGEGYSQGLEEWNQKAAAAKAANPISYGAGAVTGAVAPALIPGVGELGLAGNAALGAGYALGNTDLSKDPGEIAKQGLEGAAIGGATHGILKYIMPSAEGLESFANKKGVQALNLKPGMLGVSDQELEDMGQLAHETGLLQGSTQERVQKAQDLLQQVGAQVGDSGAGAQPLQDASPFLDKLHSHLQESSSIYGPDANPEATIYRQGMANLQQPEMTFDKLQQLKTMYGQRAFDNMGNVKNDAAANVYSQIKDAMKSIVDSSPEQYQDLMDQYGTLKDIHSGLYNQLQQEQAKGTQSRGFGMVGRLAGMMGKHPMANVAAAAALTPVHPFMALGALTPIATNPEAVSNLARSAASAVPKVSQAIGSGSMDAITSKLFGALQTNPQSLGKFAAPLQQAAQTGGSQGIAATHFLLANQYPEYNSIIMGKDQDNANQ